MNEMHGKVALITGAATGIGRAAAQLFAREGASLLLADLNEEQGEELAAQLRAGGSKAVFVKTDVAKAQDCERMVNAAVEHFGRLDAAFNNAGISDCRCRRALSTIRWSCGSGSSQSICPGFFTACATKFAPCWPRVAAASSTPRRWQDRSRLLVFRVMWRPSMGWLA